MENEKDRERPETIIGRLVKNLNERGGDALAQLTPVVYERLRRLGRQFMRRERSGHTMQPTEVVHEALARIQHGRVDGYNDTQHFYATVATHMRWVLVEHARHRRNKLIKAQLETNGEDSISSIDTHSDELLLGLHEALLELEKQDAELARACELHYFGGHTLPETAELMGISVATVTRKLRLAKAWLATQMNPSSKPSEGSDG